jgi:DeoR/GlpR family transcriptional regulator of sugar metabolism
VDSDGGGDQPAFTVVTNALNIANDLAVRRNIKLVVTGGVARPSSYELIGPLAEPALSRLHLDCVVLGVDAFDVEVGASADHEGEAAVNALMVSRATTVIVVADASKLGRRSFAQICPISAVDVLITDTSADPDLVAAFEAADVTVVRA